MIQNNKTIKIIHNKNFLIYSINNKNILVFNTLLDKKYLLIPDFVKISADDTFVNFQYMSGSSLLFDNFKTSLNNFLKNLNRPYRKKMYLKGLGFRVSISEDKKFLSLKLGYSHISSLCVPTGRLSLKVNKSTIVVEGFNAVEVGNFASEIRSLRNPDANKGKGIWYKNEIKNLKELKKK